MRALSALVLLAAPLLAQAERSYGETLRLKIDVGGEERKIALFIPDNVKKGENFPLLVALPDTQGKAMLEVGQWQQPAFDKRFCVVSVDIKTSGEQGWHPKEQLEMQRDMEAVTESIRVAREEAKAKGILLDDSATVLTGFSGGTYLTLWLGIRRPDLFLGVCGRCCVFHKEAAEFSKFDKTEPNKAMPIFLYYGEVDNPRVKKETELARSTLAAAGFTNVQLKVVAGMAHESKPEEFLDWYGRLLKETERPRKEAMKIKVEVEKLRPDVVAGKAGAYGKLAKLVEHERKVGAKGGAADLLGEVLAEAKKKWDAAANLEADNRFQEAADAFGKVEKDYMPLDVAKEAREKRLKILNSDAFKAAEMLAKAKDLIEKGAREKAVPILEKIADQYGETPAADEARLLLTG
ncbi:MAG: prolyl oligopeptidase family serine peptidase [Planctomycetes bacterium]|nr:prolyl oligopeptidase family serine peptidase [Planctomycetota bacterium]